MMDTLFRADTIINIAVSPLMVFMSLLGNLLAFLVLSRRSFSSMPMSVYLRVLAVMDTGTVITGLLPRFILALTDYDVRGTTELSCQCQVYIVYVFTELSAWTLVMVTSERVLAITKPHRVKILCTKFKSYVIIVVAASIIIVVNIPIFFFFGKYIVSSSKLSNTIDHRSNETNSTGGISSTANKTFSYRVCGFRNTYTASAQAWFLTHFIKQSLIPFIVIFTLNIAIIKGLLRRRSSLLKNCVERFNSLRSNHISSHRPADVQGQAMSRKDASLTVTLVIINIVFLVSNFPIGIYQQIAFHFPDRYENSELSLVYSMLVFILYLNNTLNFMLYSVTGSRFRNELHNMFTCSP